MRKMGIDTYLILFQGLFFVYIISIIVGIKDEKSLGKNSKKWTIFRFLVIIAYLIAMVVIMELI